MLIDTAKSNLSTILSTLSPSERVKVIFPNGSFLQGKKKKIQRMITLHQSKLMVDKIKIAYSPIGLFCDLKKEILIYIEK